MQDSVGIAFLAASLNDPDLSVYDISRAYLNAPCGENVWFKASPEYRVNKGKVMVVRRALYGLKSSTNVWRTFFATSLKSLGYKSCEADPDILMKKEYNALG